MGIGITKKKQIKIKNKEEYVKYWLWGKDINVDNHLLIKDWILYFLCIIFPWKVIILLFSFIMMCYYHNILCGEVTMPFYAMIIFTCITCKIGYDIGLYYPNLCTLNVDVFCFYLFDYYYNEKRENINNSITTSFSSSSSTFDNNDFSSSSNDNKDVVNNQYQQQQQKRSLVRKNKGKQQQQQPKKHLQLQQQPKHKEQQQQQQKNNKY